MGLLLLWILNGQNVEGSYSYFMLDLFINDFMNLNGIIMKDNEVYQIMMISKNLLNILVSKHDYDISFELSARS